MPADGKMGVGTHDRPAHLWDIVISVAPCADGQITMWSFMNQATMAFKQILRVPQRWPLPCTKPLAVPKHSASNLSFPSTWNLLHLAIQKVCLPKEGEVGCEQASNVCHTGSLKTPWKELEMQGAPSTQCTPLHHNCPLLQISSAHGLMGDNSSWISHVPACLTNRNTVSFHSRLSFRGCLYRKQPWKTEIISLSRAGVFAVQ